jgi:predicted amidohydrolase
MLVGPVFDVRSFGQSRICQNLGDAACDPHASLLAEAHVNEEDVICATVDVASADASHANGAITRGIGAIADIMPRMVAEAHYGSA